MDEMTSRRVELIAKVAENAFQNQAILPSSRRAEWLADTLKGLLVGEGYKTGRLHVRTLMKRMGIEAICRRPNTSKPAPGHKIYPYLLRNLPITRPNQVGSVAKFYAIPVLV